MTNETKIGLLVGLAFIIVIGILLSDFNRNETQPAALIAVADNVRGGTATLHNGSNTTEVVPPPAPSSPLRPVPTHDELREETRISVNGPIAHEPDRRDNRSIPETTPANGQNTLHRPSPVDTDEGNPKDDANTAPRIGDQPETPHVEVPHLVPPIESGPPTVNGAQQYVALPGDTVSKLAGRFMGKNTKTNREAIIAANASLKQNPNNVIVGRTYIIPNSKTAPAALSPIRIAANPTPAPTPTASGPQFFYTVRENDNLWKIAANQLGDGNAWAAIKDLNKDVLKGRDDVRPNMRLRLPAKPIASIN